MNFSWLSLHYPFEETWEEKRNTVLPLSLSAGIILILLQPFGFSVTEHSLHLGALLLIGILTLGINFQYVPYFLPKLFNESKWSIAKALLFLTYNFLIIGLWNHIYQVIVIEENVFLIASGEQLLSSLLKLVAIGLAASGFLVLVRYNILTRRHLQIAQELNESSAIKNGKLTLDGPDTIQFLLENQELVIDRNDLMWISAEGNYISLRTRREKQLPLFRATMKQVERSLLDYPEFFRCHRSHFINLNAISNLKGNSQGLFVQLNDYADKIPVARPKIKWLRDAFQQRSNAKRQFVTK